MLERTLKSDNTRLPKIEFVAVDSQKDTTQEVTKTSIIVDNITPDRTVEIVDEIQIFTQFLQLEVGDGAASSDTIRNYLSHTKQYLDWCKNNLVPVKDADKQDLQLYRQYLIEKDLKPATIATKLNILRRFYGALVERGAIATNPLTGIKAPKNSQDPAARITFLEPEELSYLFDYINRRLAEVKTNKKRLPLLRDRLLLGIMALEGCRTIELHELKMGNIVKQGNKTGLRVAAKRASRIVPLTDNLTVWLDEYLAMRRKVIRRKLTTSDRVFISLSNQNKGGQLSRRGIRDIVDKYLIATDLKHTPGRTISAHSLRHTAGTLAIRSGSELRQVQDLLGHADPKTTAIYTHVGDRWKNNPGEGIEKLL